MSQPEHDATWVLANRLLHLWVDAILSLEEADGYSPEVVRLALGWLNHEQELIERRRMTDMHPMPEPPF